MKERSKWPYISSKLLGILWDMEYFSWLVNWVRLGSQGDSEKG